MASNGMSKEALAAAGNEKYAFSSKKQIAYPEGETVIWHGYIRHNFELEGNHFVNICIDLAMRGVGSHSCGPDLLEQYRLSEKEIHFAFTMHI